MPNLNIRQSAAEAERLRQYANQMGLDVTAVVRLALGALIPHWPARQPAPAPFVVLVGGQPTAQFPSLTKALHHALGLEGEWAINYEPAPMVSARVVTNKTIQHLTAAQVVELLAQYG